MATLSTKNLAQAIYEASHDKEGKELSVILANATQMLADKNLLSRAKDILQSLQDIFDKENGVVRVYVESTNKLSKDSLDEIESEIKKRYKAKEVYIEAIINEEHLGGIKIRVADEIIDLTLAHRIKALQDHLITH